MISEDALLAASRCAYKDMQERAIVIQAAFDQVLARAVAEERERLRPLLINQVRKFPKGDVVVHTILGNHGIEEPCDVCVALRAVAPAKDMPAPMGISGYLMTPSKKAKETT